MHRLMHLAFKYFISSHHREQDEVSAPQTRGLVITFSARRYDLMVRLGTRFYLGGSEQALRHMIADLAQLQPGETVLDVGCGTGTLAMVAKERVGAAGRVYGIDPSVQLLAGARRKAARPGCRLPARCDRTTRVSRSVLRCGAEYDDDAPIA